MTFYMEDEVMASITEKVINSIEKAFNESVEKLKEETWTDKSPATYEYQEPYVSAAERQEALNTIVMVHKGLKPGPLTPEIWKKAGITPARFPEPEIKEKADRPPIVGDERAKASQAECQSGQGTKTSAAPLIFSQPSAPTTPLQSSVVAASAILATGLSPASSVPQAAAAAFTQQSASISSESARRTVETMSFTQPEVVRPQQPVIPMPKPAPAPAPQRPAGNPHVRAMMTSGNSARRQFSARVTFGFR